MRIVNKIPRIVKRQMSIKNMEFKVCKNCVHFTNSVTNDPFDLPVDDILLGRCKLFGEKNLITGEIKYDLARTSRVDDTKCGTIARQFEQVVGEPEEW